MSLKVLTMSDYVVTPWKNGGGVTSDVFLFPDGATQENFDIRLSLAPIVTEGAFSSFPGIDRHITRLSATPLGLVFGGEIRELKRLEPLYFDSVLQPRSVLPEGPAQVLNVMTRRGRWNAQVMPVVGGNEPLLAVPDGGLVVLHAVTGTWQVGDRVGSVIVRPGETLISREESTLRASSQRDGEAIVAFLSPTRRYDG
ncbi:HutD/Ves family protein [Ancylobacter defluvii]|uniref:Histidine utilization protein HutD n=1 Tax=Ancylobacter defluvii TaxID=1282440 RepID=A0A9W6JXP5_9HYPH|nr:HutD family protein [Ancylobacter defluvii]GLK85052.1 histidine utilization protein HutD [Ancylobacter defluvii]